MNVLVIGATGQLGSKIFTMLSCFKKFKVKAFVREKSNFHKLNCHHKDIIFGDLVNKQSLLVALKDIDIVISTATVVFPRGNSKFEIDERIGYKNLIEVCQEYKMKQIIFISIASEFNEIFLKNSKTYELKYWCENLIMESNLPYTIIKCSLFMDDYFSLIGSKIPLYGEKLATINRMNGLLGYIGKCIQLSMDKIGVAWIPGNINSRHSFISIEDVAKHCIIVCGNKKYYKKSLKIGGPENISWKEICEIFSLILSRNIRPISIPSNMLYILLKFFKLFSEKISNQLAILWIVSIIETKKDGSWDCIIDDKEMKKSYEYLFEKKVTYEQDEFMR